MELRADVLVGGHLGRLFVRVAVEEGVVGEEGLAGLLEGRHLGLEGVQVVQDDIVALQLQGVVLVHLLGQFHLLLLHRQVDLLE